MLGAWADEWFWLDVSLRAEGPVEGDYVEGVVHTVRLGVSGPWLSPDIWPGQGTEADWNDLLQNQDIRCDCLRP